MLFCGAFKATRRRQGPGQCEHSRLYMLAVIILTALFSMILAIFLVRAFWDMQDSLRGT
jgi:hypothetical protein